MTRSFASVPRRATQSSIAAMLGVSQALVSRVLSRGPSAGISAETRLRVLEAARRVGYVPDRAAQMLRSRRSWTIACVIPDITNPFYPALERGVQEVALAAGYDVLAVNTDGDARREDRTVEWARQRRVDGLVGVFFGLQPADFARLESAGVPAVCIGWREVPPGATMIDSLFTDNRRAAREAASYLLARGHRRIVMFGAAGGPGPDREAGYADAMRGAGLSPVVERADGFTEEAGYRLAARLLGNDPRAGAVFAVNDLVAAGAMLALREAGRHVPDDVAVMGFDDIQLARLLTPALTTVNQFQHEAGRQAAAMLIERLSAPGAHDTGRSREVAFRIVPRHSA